MAIIGLSLAENFPWYSPRDPASDNHEKTKFVLGSIDVMVRSHIQDNSTAWLQTEGGMQLMPKTSTRNYEAVRFGLKEVENFKDIKGNDLKVTFVDRVVNGKVYKAVSDEFLNLLDGRDVADMAEAIIAANTDTDALRKK